jgi:hypothetical protein
MSWEDAILNFFASIGARTAFYYLQKWLDGLNISISIGKIKHDYLKDTFEERGQVYVGYHNGAIPLEAFLAEYDGEPCPWWDNNSTTPRNLVAGGGGNVLIRNPSPSKVLVMKSKGKVIERCKLSEITLRV